MTGFLHIASPDIRRPSKPIAMQRPRMDLSFAAAERPVAVAARVRLWRELQLTLTTVRYPNGVRPETRSVGGGKFTVGRALGNDWVLPDSTERISRQHFTIVFQDGFWTLTDQSTNGTFLNRETSPIGHGNIRTLRDGDRIRFGSYELEARLTEQRHPRWSFRRIGVFAPPGRGNRDVMPAAGGGKASPDPLDAYLERLLKLIPAEVVSIYPVGLSLVPDDGQQGLWTVVCLIICVLFRIRMTRGPDNQPQWAAIGIAMVSFIIWVYVLGAHILGLALPAEYKVWPALMMLAWTTVVPGLYSGQRSSAMVH